MFIQVEDTGETWKCPACSEFVSTQKMHACTALPLKTLRDEFAMAALTGLIDEYQNDPSVLVAKSYSAADAMLKARETPDVQS